MFQNYPYYYNGTVTAPMPYSPTVPAQQRMQQYEQPYGDPGARGMVKCKAVTSVDEARASIIDLDGSMHIFTDFNNKKIYTKYIGLDGNAVFNTYILTENEETSKNNIYASHSDLEKMRQEFYGCLDDINSRVDRVAESQMTGTVKKQGTKK